MQNIILISLDTLRADVAYSGQFPAIEKLRKKGVTFLNTVSSAPLTPISHATIFTGLQPYNHGIRHLFKEKLNDDAETLAAILKRTGYQTGAVVSCPGMNKWYGFSKGFDHYDDEIPLLPDGTNALETVDVKLRGRALKRAPLVTERAGEWMKSIDTNKPFALFIHFFDAHWPYEAPEVFAGKNIYEEEVAYSDHYLGLFMDDLEKKGLLDDALIVCFSDHGEDLDGMYENDKGGEKNGHPEEFGHGNLLYEQTQKVPLIISSIDLPKNISISDQVRLVDITPTILSLLDISVDIDFDGVDLNPIINGEKAELVGYSETSYPEEQNEATNNKYPNSKNKTSFVFNNDQKVILHEGVPHEHFSLKKDPNEKHNLL
jgi:arylsulfatase